MAARRRTGACEDIRSVQIRREPPHRASDVDDQRRRSVLHAGEAPGFQVAEDFVSDLPAIPLTLVTPGRKQILNAASLKARFPLSYADAFAVETALENGASL